MKFGERLRSLREDRDEKQKDIAKLLYVSPNMISAYELGKHFPKNEDALICLADHFGVSLDYLLGYSNLPAYNTDNVISVNGLNTKEKAIISDLINLLKSTKQKR